MSSAAFVLKERENKPISPLGRNLYRLRRRQGFTRQKLAEASGVSATSVAMIEYGEVTNPRVNTVAAMAKAMGVPLGELVGEKG